MVQPRLSRTALPVRHERHNWIVNKINELRSHKSNNLLGSPELSTEKVASPQAHIRRRIGDRRLNPDTACSLFVSVTNTNEDIILAVNELFAALSTVARVSCSTARRGKPPDTKTCYRVHVAGGVQVTRVLYSLVLPYLVGKRKQAEVLLAIVKHRKSVCEKAGHRGAGTR